MTKPDASKGEQDHVYPKVLPDGRHVLFAITTSEGGDTSQVAVLDLATGTYRTLLRGGNYPRYVEPGYIAYGVAGTLRAVPFDLSRLEVTGPPVPVLDKVLTNDSGSAGVDVARNGTLAYITGGPNFRNRSLVWTDNTGREESLGLPPRPYNSPALSPDGKRVALEIETGDGGDSDIWVWSVEQRTLSRLTFEPGPQENPVWTRDGTRIVYRSNARELSWRRADGTGAPELIYQASRVDGVRPASWAVDGRLLIDENLAGSSNIAVLSLGSRATRTPLLAAPNYAEGFAQLSPDGRWLAYTSNESRRQEVYVRPFPAVDAGKWQISTSGGARPQWALDGRALFFIGERGGVMRADVVTTPTFSSTMPSPVVGDDALGDAANIGFAVTLDGLRVLVAKVVGTQTSPPQLNVILHWGDELRRLMTAR